MADETIDEIFAEMIKETMTNDEFWEWVADWKDVETLIEEAENWDEQMKLDDIAHYVLVCGEKNINPDWRARARKLFIEEQKKIESNKR